MSEYIEISEIGKIELVRSRRIRRFNLRVSPPDKIRLSMPEGTSRVQVLAFLESKKQWIQEGLHKVQSDFTNRNTIFEEHTAFKTRTHSLQIQQQGEVFRIEIHDFKVWVYYPLGSDIRQMSYQQSIRQALEEVWRWEAKCELPKRLAKFAKKAKFHYNNVTIRKSTTRWGSCSSENNINLSLHLMRLPDRLIDYVIWHELCHTVEKNHSEDFWNLLEKVLPGAKVLDKELRHYSTVLY
ncbi:MAG: M48 family metallopeptidase [Bernardetiaceae bacterium]|nr:M48 family metallopeptidase [Bernardetiaceae bacterium]